MIRSNIQAVPKDQCTGCMACKSQCVLNAIYGDYNAEGFLIPVIDEKKCISCGKCFSVCPTQKKALTRHISDGFLAVRVNEKGRQNSTSAGVAYSIAKCWLEQGGVVCGAVVCEDLIVRHRIAHTVSQLELQQGSKYVQSSIECVFPDIRKELENEKDVLFCGTPCQVAAVQNVFHDQVTYIDLVCHGVCAPLWLKKYIHSLAKDMTVKNIKFRTSDKFEKSGYNLEILLENGKSIRKFGKLDTYMYLFLNGQNFRESCYRCQYASPERVGDLTLGDCASFRDYRTWLKGRVPSIVLPHTHKGVLLWERVQSEFEIKTLDVQKEIQQNHNLHRPTVRPTNRSQIGVELVTNSVSDIRKRYVKYSNKQVLAICVRRIIPVSIRRRIIGFFEAMKGLVRI